MKRKHTEAKKANRGNNLLTLKSDTAGRAIMLWPGKVWNSLKMTYVGIPFKGNVKRDLMSNKLNPDQSRKRS